MYATLDIESTGLNRYKDEITYIGIQINQSLEDQNPTVYTFQFSNKLDREEFLVLMQQLKEKKARLVWQNGKFDTLFIEHKTGLKLPISEDVMLMGTAYDLGDKHGLKYMAQKYLQVEDWDISKREKTKGSQDVIVPYLKLDVKYTWELFCFFRKVMDKKQIKIYRKLLLPAYITYCQVEKNGIYLNVDEYQIVKQKYEDLEAEWLKKLTDRYPINWNSSQQKQEILFTDKGENLPVLKVTPAGKPSADASVMRRLAAQGHEIPQMILEYQKVNTANKMFLRRYGDDAFWDGRIHPTFNLTNVRSGRTSSSDPNLQQCTNNPDIRNLFTTPNEDRIFFEADYSQLELRLAAHYAQEPTMLRIYREDGDIHTETAKIMTGGKEPTKAERKKAKAVNH